MLTPHPRQRFASDLDRPRAGAGGAPRVDVRIDVGFHHGDAQPVLQVGDRTLEQRRFPRARRRHQIDQQRPFRFQFRPQRLRVPVVGRGDRFLQFDDLNLFAISFFDHARDRDDALHVV